MSVNHSLETRRLAASEPGWLLVACIAFLYVALVGCEESSLSESDRNYLQSSFTGSPGRELAFAAAEGKGGKIRDLVDQGADVNGEGGDGETILVVAVDFQQPQSVATLLELGADPNHEFGRGRSVMHAAIGNRNPEILKMLLDGGGNPDAGSDNRSALIVGLSVDGALDEVKLLIEAGADPDGRGLNDDTAMIAAARSKNFELVHYLLENGADYALENRADESLVSFIENQTYVHVSGVDYHEKVIEFLRSKGEEVEPR